MFNKAKSSVAANRSKIMSEDSFHRTSHSLQTTPPFESMQERREFLKRLCLAATGLMIARGARAGNGTTTAESFNQVPRRKFGRHDFTVSSLSLGGHTLRKADDTESPKFQPYRYWMSHQDGDASDRSEWA
jgi:hypothetical protein